MKGVGSGGGFVFTERVDYTKPGDTWIPIPLVAVFEVNERGKIFAWREYLDGVTVRARTATKSINRKSRRSYISEWSKCFKGSEKGGCKGGYRIIQSGEICGCPCS